MSQTRVYKYGLMPPEVGDRVSEQMLLNHRYQNRLVEIERGRRARARAIQEAHDTVTPIAREVEALDAQKKAAVADLKAQRKKTRSRSETDEQRQRVADLRKLHAEARARLKAAKKQLREENAIIKEELRKSDDQADAEAKTARAECQVYWGTYLLAEKAMMDAKKEKTDPSYHSWTGRGSVGVQIQGGMTWEEATSGTDTQLQILLEPRRCGPGAARPYVRLRVGSTEKRGPIWAEWPLILHRLPPPGARIMGARVIRERLEAKDRWSLHLTLRLPDDWRIEDHGHGTVAVDLGWRKRPGGLRVAYLRDDQGEHREVLLGPNVLDGFRQVDGLRSVRDDHLNVLRPWLAQWLREHELPSWLREATTTLHLWESFDRFAALALRWRGLRWSGDEEGFARLEAWRKRDKHLWTYEANLRDKVLHRRLDQYRVLGAELARRYDTIVLEEMDLSEMQRHRKPEDKKREIQPARAQQRLASPSELRGCLINAFTARGGRVVEVDPSNTTRACHACGLVEVWDQVASLTHACTGCGEVWDQDDNACRNMLRRARELPASDAPPARPAEARWARLKREKIERSKVEAEAPVTAEVAG